MTARQVCLGRHRNPYADARTVVDGDNAPVKPFPAGLGEPGRRAVAATLGHRTATTASYDIALIVRSGDLFVVGGASRLACHGVPRVYAGTGPQWLGPRGRLNVTLRVSGFGGGNGTERIMGDSPS